MIRFNEWLQQENFSNLIHNITPNIEKEFSIALSSDVELYRGMMGVNLKTGEWKVISGKNRKLESMQDAGSGLLDILIDSFLPSWSKVPKRNKSLSISNNVAKANFYGEIYSIFVSDSAETVVCPAEDLWTSFEKTVSKYWRSGIQALDRYLTYYPKNALFVELNTFLGKNTIPDLTKKENINKENIGVFLRTLQSVFDDDFERFKNYLKAKDSTSLVNLITGLYPNVISGFDNMFNFHKNNFNIESTNTLYKTVKTTNALNTTHEIWVSGDIIIVGR